MGSFEARTVDRHGVERSIHLTRAAEVERDLETALARNVVGDDEMFVCDRCGCPTRTLAVKEEAAVGSCCS